MNTLANRPHDEPTVHDGHPDFCTGKDDPVGCGTHLGPAVAVPATAGRPQAACDGAVFPAALVAPAYTPDGTRGVSLEILTPSAHLPVFRLAEVDTLIAALTAARTRAVAA